MKKIYLIGIGPGDPRYLTIEAIETMKNVDVFFILEKGSEKNTDLVKIRKEILKRFLNKKRYRVITVKVPERKKAGRNTELYKERVDTWRMEKADIIGRLIKEEMNEDEKGALLIWGDPSLYDGHIEILRFIKEEMRMDIDFEVIPGITSIQVLTAKHKIPLNRVAESIMITTPRGLQELNPSKIKNTVVLLDNYLTYRNYKDSDLHIYWGAYIGTPHEVLISGKIRDVLDNILKIRDKRKKEKNWIMETYILRSEK